MYILKSDEMRALEHLVMDTYKIPGLLLMEHAGSAIAEILLKEKLSSCIVVCGRGNNGGDGFVIARQLLLKSVDVKVVVLGSSEIKGDALTNYKILERMCQIYDDIDRIDLNDADVIVDAIFGIGLDRDIKGDYLKAINKINSSASRVVAVDIPSGVNGSTGHIMGKAIKADVTICLEAFKVGHKLYPGAEYCGELILRPIGIPKESYVNYDFNCLEITEDYVRKIMPVRKANTHKGSFGKASVIAGSKGMEGAAILLCSAAMKSGLGLLELHMIDDINDVIKPAVPEILTTDYQLNKVIDSDVVAIGSGCGMSEEFSKVLGEVIAETRKPLVIDADGINVLSHHMEWLKGEIVITPHIKEMSRLTGMTVEAILEDTIGIAKSFAKEHQIVVVLKSARTVVALPTGETFINTTGNSGMAVAGMGDVLTGLITSLIGQGLSIGDASILGVYLHGLSGDNVRNRIGPYGLLPTDVVLEISKIMMELSHE